MENAFINQTEHKVQNEQSQMAKIAVNLVNKYIAQQDFFIEKKQTPSISFGTKFEDTMQGGGYDMLNKKIMISYDENKIVTIYNLIHELFHHASFFHQCHSHQSLMGNHSIIIPKLAGYQILSFNSRFNKTFQYFDGWDEIVTNVLAFECIHENIHEILPNFNFFKKDANDIHKEFRRYCLSSITREGTDLLNTILQGIKDRYKVSDTDMSIVKEMKQGYFNHDMGFLRKIKDVFGKGSLQMLALFPYSIHNEDLALQVLAYFQSSNQEEKTCLRKNIVDTVKEQLTQ